MTSLPFDCSCAVIHLIKSKLMRVLPEPVSIAAIILAKNREELSFLSGIKELYQPFLAHPRISSWYRRGKSPLMSALLCVDMVDQDKSTMES